ncbi:MAG: GTP cyclohydrolase I [Desulfobacterales bacterium]|nr:GTP cyclohydrolase I [Desulfobacterales bacterium]
MATDERISGNIDAEHLCMSMRGIKKLSQEASPSPMRGTQEQAEHAGRAARAHQTTA